MRNHPVKHKTIMHNGVDLAAHYENVFSMKYFFITFLLF